MYPRLILNYYVIDDGIEPLVLYLSCTKIIVTCHHTSTTNVFDEVKSLFSQRMLERMWGKRNAPPLLMGVQTCKTLY